MKTDDVHDTYEERCERMLKLGEWGSTFELLVAKALGLDVKVVIGEDRSHLRFQRGVDDVERIFQEEPVLWYHKYEGLGSKPNHYDLLMTQSVQRAVLKRKYPDRPMEELLKEESVPSGCSVSMSSVGFDSDWQTDSA